MSVAEAPSMPGGSAGPLDTMAELLRALGDVPPERVLLRPTPGTATEADVLRLVEGEPKRLVELVDGTLVEKPMGLNESEIALVVATFLNNHLFRTNQGIVYGPDGTTKMAGGNIRMPDVMFVPWSGLPDGKRPQMPISLMGATLAVEVLSASNSKREMRRKRSDYFASGIQLVWEIDPVRKVVEVFRPGDAQPELADRNGVLNAGGALPGFELDLSLLWSIVERTGPASH